MTDHSTATGAATTTIVFDSPDGRTWTRDTDHQTGPRAPMMRTPFIEAFRVGMTAAFERLGAPLSHAETVHVHGWSYLRMVPAGVPDKPGAGAPPPAPVLKVLTRLVPELRRRERIARRAIADEIWTDDVRAWWDERPRWAATFRRHQAIDLDTLDDAELSEAITRAVDDGMAMLVRHFELITPAVGIGVALLTAADHGLDPASVATALRGASASTADPRQQIRTIAQRLDAHGVPAGASLDQIRATSGEVDHLVAEYLDTYGWRLLGDDLDAPTTAESPEVVARAVEAARRERHDRLAPDGDEIDALASRVPSSARAEFARQLRGAAEAYEVLDDNSSYVCWGLGVARRLLLEAGRRLAGAGVLAAADDLWLLELDEVRAALLGDPPTAADLDARRAVLAAQRAADAPDVLGGPPAPPPDPAVFPRGLRTIASAVGLYLSLRFPPPDAQADTGRVEVGDTVVATGHGVGASVAEGRAVVAATPHDAIERLEPGDILVCPMTNPAYNVVFPMVAGVVTAAGGPFGHTAVTAREVGIPAVVGIGDLSVITDGEPITIRSDA